MFLLYLVNAFQSTILYSLTPFVTSAFESHSLLTVIGIVANALSAAIYIPLAKMLDLWGRAEGFLLMIVFAELGLILQASCNNLYTYCAAQVCSSLVILERTGHRIPSCKTHPLIMIGLLHHWFWRHDIRHRCHHS